MGKTLRLRLKLRQRARSLDSLYFYFHPLGENKISITLFQFIGGELPNERSESAGQQHLLL
jgi:hypothetical protein